MWRALADIAGSVISMLEAGSKAPDFTLPDQDGHDVALADQHGHWVVLWWYPKASTRG
jgi:peroxiredoxin Q/BCP